MAQAIYNVEGTTTSGPLHSLEVETFNMNVCAMNKTHAAEIASARLQCDGFRGTVIGTIHLLTHSCGHYELADTLRIK